MGRPGPEPRAGRIVLKGSDTWHRWQNQSGGMEADDAKELREVAKENQRLKKIVADQAARTAGLRRCSQARSWRQQPGSVGRCQDSVTPGS